MDTLKTKYFGCLSKNDQNLLKYISGSDKQIYEQLNFDSKLLLAVCDNKISLLNNTYIIACLDLFIRNKQNTRFIAQKLIDNYIKSTIDKKYDEFPINILIHPGGEYLTRYSTHWVTHYR